ncbi:Uncharacterised protein [Schaalia odontolytica]|uniref:Centromere-binding protein ParB C-terminal domain-containing protein n=1 Tax=Schaalia odontolytica TaxID=1660 RepID=A0A2X0VQ39_9ACTO|nr:Uncharacterised protein [Schaalia odontolytica]
MTPRRPTPIRSDLSTGPAAVIAPPRETTSTSRATRARKAANSGNAGNASDTDERIVKVTARVSADIAGRCRAAYIDGVLEGGPASFEAWIVEAMTAALARAEKKRGRRYEPLAADRIPKGRR